MSAVLARKKSPRAPSISLDEALDRALKAYDKERLHPAPTEVVAQNLGYKSANNGAALSALASLRYYGLVERPKDGLLAITKDVESYKFSPNDEHKQSLLIDFLKKPAIFAELLVQYESGLPSDANIRYELIQRGFSPNTAESVVTIFRKSVDFAGFFSAPQTISEEGVVSSEAQQGAAKELHGTSPSQPQPLEQSTVAARSPSIGSTPMPVTTGEGDQIPIRLHGGRRAWLVIPAPFYEADKVRLKAQIDLLLTQDEEDEA
jgi:hypothetical protein